VGAFTGALRAEGKQQTAQGEVLSRSQSSSAFSLPPVCLPSPRFKLSLQTNFSTQHSIPIQWIGRQQEVRGVRRSFKKRSSPLFLSLSFLSLSLPHGKAQCSRFIYIPIIGVILLNLIIGKETRSLPISIRFPPVTRYLST